MESNPVDAFVRWAESYYGQYKRGRHTVELYLNDLIGNSSDMSRSASYMEQIRLAVRDNHPTKFGPPGVSEIRRACKEAGIGGAIQRRIVSSACPGCHQWLCWPVGRTAVCQFCGAERTVDERMASAIEESEKRWKEKTKWYPNGINHPAESL